MIVREYTYGNVIITIYRPQLSVEELKKVEGQILISLQQIGKELKENE